MSKAETTTRSTLLYELSVSRLLKGGDAYLDVIRNADNTTIIHVPLIQYFLLEKGNRYNQFGEQEYLDRRDDYSALFFLDDNSNWYVAGGIYINNWVIVPPQEVNN
ncbi:MAG: FimB/Mfa2 family fimbrial subunit, partial [Muribaculaceae bacterium]|nr:FimB/Mfa2 family fimbrial subunit [Muribaculaceae bacterium]